MHEAYLTSQKEVASGHWTLVRTQSTTIVFPNIDKIFEFQLIDTRCDKYVFIARPKAYLTSKKKVVTQQTQSKTLLSLFSQTLTKYLSFNALTHDETNMSLLPGRRHIWLLRRSWQVVTQQTQQTHCTALFLLVSQMLGNIRSYQISNQLQG